MAVDILQLMDNSPHRRTEIANVGAGVEDDGYPRGLTPGDLEQSLTTLRAMAAEVHAACTLVRTLPGSSDRSCVVVRVHRICRDEVSYTDLRIAGALPSCKNYTYVLFFNWRASVGEHCACKPGRMSVGLLDPREGVFGPDRCKIFSLWALAGAVEGMVLDVELHGCNAVQLVNKGIMTNIEAM